MLINLASNYSMKYIPYMEFSLKIENRHRVIFDPDTSISIHLEARKFSPGRASFPTIVVIGAENSKKYYIPKWNQNATSQVSSVLKSFKQGGKNV